MKIFISVGMTGRKEEDVRKDISRATTEIHTIFKNYSNIEIIHNYDIEGPENAGRLWYLGNAIVKMDGCDAIFFTRDYHEYRGCLVEEDIAKLYDMKRIYEDSFNGRLFTEEKRQYISKSALKTEEKIQ